MKKVLLSLLLACCMTITIGCGSDISKELSSSHIASSAKKPVVTKEAAQNTSDDYDEEEELLDIISGKIPYKGLPEKYIEDTIVGSYDRMEDAEDNDDLESDQTAYYWESDDEKYDVLKVVCESGSVVKVKKYYPEVYWNDKVPDFSADKDAYDKKQAEKEAKAAAAATDAEQETMVWIPNSGSCYHSKPTCSNMKNPTQVTISEAERMNKRPCKKCY